MTAEPGDRPGLDDISDPETPPPDAPDGYTNKETKTAKSAASRPSQGDRYASAVDRHIEDACRVRDALKNETSQLPSDLNRLQGELSLLRVQHQKLGDTHRSSVIGTTLSTIILTVG
jgi:hypothetical protein